MPPSSSAARAAAPPPPEMTAWLRLCLPDKHRHLAGGDCVDHALHGRPVDVLGGGAPDKRDDVMDDAAFILPDGAEPLWFAPDGRSRGVARRDHHRFRPKPASAAPLFAPGLASTFQL